MNNKQPSKETAILSAMNQRPNGPLPTMSTPHIKTAPAPANTAAAPTGSAATAQQDTPLFKRAAQATLGRNGLGSQLFGVVAESLGAKGPDAGALPIAPKKKPEDPQQQQNPEETADANNNDKKQAQANHSIRLGQNPKTAHTMPKQGM